MDGPAFGVESVFGGGWCLSAAIFTTMKPFGMVMGFRVGGF
jgi:hypothetical protein